MGQDLSKEVVWAYVGPRAAKLQAIKVEGLKNNSASLLELNYTSAVRGSSPRRLYHPQSLLGHNFAAL